MTRDAERAYVKRWAETGRLLEEIRWRELRAFDSSIKGGRAVVTLNTLVRIELDIPAQTMVEDKILAPGIATILSETLK